ncbi:WD repeat-containing protein [Coprinopsis marcescibilis]|uniref:WD repeat-containing protein n=1 Tax=Coprinopsis marcescibilis TaxID=230819 RepID=A0A5C3LCJ6_COPMA|nr:WD repeat-containing protein [Coprinopsis marcescibilis]
MLQLQQTCTGYPAAGLQFIQLPKETLLLYPSVDAIIIRNAQSLVLRRILAFWEAFPGSIKARETISYMSVDSGMKLIVAAMNSRIVAWALSEVQGDAWRIHSTLILPEGYKVTSLDNKAGLLAVGTENGLSIYTLVMENDLLTWSLKWSTSAGPVIHTSFAPSLMFIATVSRHDAIVRLYSTASGRQTQSIPHPRHVVKMTWRRPQPTSRDDLILYTISSDSVLRIFLPVLDAPEYLQLHGSLDLFSSLPYSVAEDQSASESTIFWLDRRTIGTVIGYLLTHQLKQDNGRKRRIQEIHDEGWDLFLRILADGSIVVTALANIDRRPPTLLRQFTLQQSQPCVFTHPPKYLYLLPNRDPSLLTLVTSSPLLTFELSPLAFFDAQSHGLRLVASFPEREPDEESPVVRLVRTPEGTGVGAIRENRGGQAWTITRRGTELKPTGSWNECDFMVVLFQGHRWATFLQQSGILTLRSQPIQTLTLPRLESLFTMPSPNGCELIIAITEDFDVIQIMVTDEPAPQFSIKYRSKLPISSPLRFIQPVDPMAWGTSNRDWTEHDALLSVSDDGELAFWAPETFNGSPWKCTGTVKTDRSGFKKAKCSSMKKTALVVAQADSDELTIWDSTVSEFSTGLEFQDVKRQVLNVGALFFSHLPFSDRILDLDWSSTPFMQSILAVGYARHVDLVCQQRSTYFDDGPGWAVCHRISLESVTPYHIRDSVWMAHGSFLIAAGQQMYLFGDPPPNRPGDQSGEGLFEHVARRNGPLEDYHPQMLLQCLLWEKIELVKDIIVNLVKDISRHDKLGYVDSWTAAPIEQFLQTTKPSSGRARKKEYHSLFDDRSRQNDEIEEEQFSRGLVNRLISHLEKHPLPHLTPNEQAHLVVLIQTTLEIDEQRRALDANGLRYLISMRSFYITNQRANTSPTNGALLHQTGKRERLRFRDMLWAFHSESQDLLLNASTAACNGKMTWSDARALGISLWLTSPETLKQQLEIIARNEYMAGEDRDPTACSIFYFALGKYKLVQGLWRQASWHKEQGLMLKFLSNNFSEPRWKTAALKNAYALMGKQRFSYAAAFFLLGGSPKDAINVCLRHLQDFQLAIALARVVEQRNDGPILQSILSETVLPIALQLGNRWLASWTFWQLHRRDLAVRGPLVLIVFQKPLREIALAFNLIIEEIVEPHYDDPSLALLFSQLRSKTLQTVKGTSEISGRSEFNFVLQIARVFCRMGCHALALDLVRSWSFARPSTHLAPHPTSPLHSPKTSRIFPLEPVLNRRASILIDIDVTALPPSRTETPKQQHGETLSSNANEDIHDLFARKAGLGNLMKTAKQNVQIPEFDMNSFF